MLIPFLDQLEYIIRIFCALACGGVLGLERERRVKSAGLKTHMIVSGGAALMMLVSKYGFWDVLVQETIKLDPSRMAAQIVTAIGFLGAGVIFTRGFKINGVTTAAGLWTTVGIGLAFGAGMYFIGAVATALLLIIQLVFSKIKQGPLRSPSNINIKAVGTLPVLQKLRGYLEEHDCSTLRVAIIPQDDPKLYEMDLHVTLADKNYEERLMQLLHQSEAKILLLEFEP